MKELPGLGHSLKQYAKLSEAISLITNYDYKKVENHEEFSMGINATTSFLQHVTSKLTLNFEQLFKDRTFNISLQQLDSMKTFKYHYGMDSDKLYTGLACDQNTFGCVISYNEDERYKT